MRRYFYDTCRITSPQPGTAYWIRAQTIATEIAAEFHNNRDSPPVWPVRITKLQRQAVVGIRFYITFEVDRENGDTSTYAAVVVVKPAHMGTELSSLVKLIDSGKRKRKEVLFPYEESKSMTNGTEEELVFGKYHCKLRTRGFKILLEQIRSERPSLKFTTARKFAASKWRRLPEHEKMTFMEKAVEKLNKERPSSYKLTMRPNICQCRECRKPHSPSQ